MRRMYFIWLALAGLACGITACNHEAVDAQEDSALMDFLFLATASDSSATHQPHGKCNLTAIDVTDLPDAIVSYVSTNYTGAVIERAGVTEDGKYALQITKADSTKAGLIFDADGNFVKEHSHKGKGLKGTEIAVADLPAALTSYIETNYSGATIEKAVKSEEGKYGVLITKSDGTRVLLGFESDGAFIAELGFKHGDGRKGGKGKRK